MFGARDRCDPGHSRCDRRFVLGPPRRSQRGRCRALAVSTSRRGKGCAIRSTANDPHEISLDENVTRTPMYPADKYEAFKRPTDETGYGAEEIGGRFGVSAAVAFARGQPNLRASSRSMTSRRTGLALTCCG
ncbi:hypothetical protein FYJ91_12135 [Sphingomonas montanisoli]|uniref:Uncharacterized protein n=1 Tax=Sphingomonas montanisoli TaxID=2606412 RepID=A0A5D9C296_9SPHN|nr:hypothetical protein FYJ91_12135 [Sphingomonas montanisoli]